MLSRLRKLVFKIRRGTRARRYRDYATREPLGAIDDGHATKVEIGLNAKR
jgi:hypothetical protein